MSGRDRSPPESWPADDEPETELPVPEGVLLGGKYTIERVFAEGGMGIVCLGRHVQLEQPVAVKFLRRALSGRPTIVQRFLNEARALAALRSEHVVRVMDVGQLDSGRPYLVMEHLDGIHLDALLERDGPLSVEMAISYVLQVCEPLAEAHALGIVHRDIKPENLFLWSGGPTADSVKVLDFGLAKQLGASRALGVTGPQDSLGSPCFMSPEQVATPQLVDSRTDIWSLGVVLYRLLSNTLPFDGGSLVTTLSHILNAAPKSLTEISPNVDAELDAIVLRCLEKSPQARYQTMSQLAGALNDYVIARTQSQLDAAPATSVATRRPPRGSKSKVRIPGVHSRWPGALLAMTVLLGAAVYGADRSGRVRLRAITDGWLTPARLSDDAAPSLARRDDNRENLPFLRGVSTTDWVRDGAGRPTLRAVPERDILPRGALAAQSLEPPITDQERARRVAAYSDYLENEGLTKLGDVEALSPDGAAVAAQPSDETSP
jgi:serine/threonine-protein kinase